MDPPGNRYIVSCMRGSDNGLPTVISTSLAHTQSLHVDIGSHFDRAFIELVCPAWSCRPEGRRVHSVVGVLWRVPLTSMAHQRPSRASAAAGRSAVMGQRGRAGLPEEIGGLLSHADFLPWLLLVWCPAQSASGSRWRPARSQAAGGPSAITSRRARPSSQLASPAAQWLRNAELARTMSSAPGSCRSRPA